MRCRFFGLIVLAAILWTANTSEAAERHAGYYYPAPDTEETYQARARTLLNADRSLRIEFVNTVTAEQYARGYPPQYALFAKGEEAEKMIIVSLHEGAFDTIYRFRGLLAQLTAIARRTEFFREYEVEDFFTFFDLLKLLGFKQLTISDGEAFAHRVWIE